REEAETRQIAQTAAAPSAIDRRMSLSRVFYEPESLATGKFPQGSHLRGLSINVHGQNRLRARRNGIGNTLGIKVVGVRIDVDEDRLRSGLRDCFSSGDEGV